MREAIKEDEGFERELPQIAAFPATPREDVAKVVELASSVITPKALSRPKERQVRKVHSEKPQRQVRGVLSVERAAPERKRKGLFRQLFR